MAGADQGPFSPWYSDRAIHVYFVFGVSGAAAVHVAPPTRPESAATVPAGSVIRNRYWTAAVEYVRPPPVTVNVGVRVTVVTLFNGETATGVPALSDGPPVPPGPSLPLADTLPGATGAADVIEVDWHADAAAMSAPSAISAAIGYALRFMTTTPSNAALL